MMPTTQVHTRRVLSLVSTAIALCMLTACRSTEIPVQSLPPAQSNLASAVNYLVPTLQQLSAFGSDRFLLTSSDVSAPELSAVAESLRHAGAAVSLLPQSDDKLPAKLELNPARTLTLTRAQIGDTTLLTLSLEDVSLQCSFAPAGGVLQPSSAISVMRRQ